MAARRRPGRRHAGSGRADSSRAPARHAARRRAEPRPASPGSGSGQERLETAEHRRHRGLLQHQLADQDAPGVRPPPGGARQGSTRLAPSYQASSRWRSWATSAGGLVPRMVPLALNGKITRWRTRWRRTRARGKGGAVRRAGRWHGCWAPFSTRPPGDAASPRPACWPTGRRSSARSWRGAASPSASSMRRAGGSGGTLVLQASGGGRDRGAARRAPADRADQHLFRPSCHPAAPPAADAAAAARAAPARGTPPPLRRRTRL